MILQYSNDIYPMDLWVGTEQDVPYANKNFLHYYSVQDLQQDKPIENSQIDPFIISSTSAVTYVVRHKKSGIKGILILFNMTYIKEGDYCFILDTVSHESSHAVDAVYQVIRETSGNYDDGNEPHAYLTGWFAGCIGSYLTKYFKKLNERKEV